MIIIIIIVIVIIIIFIIETSILFCPHGVMHRA